MVAAGVLVTLLGVLSDDRLDRAVRRPAQPVRDPVPGAVINPLGSLPSWRWGSGSSRAAASLVVRFRRSARRRAPPAAVADVRGRPGCRCSSASPSAGRCRAPSADARRHRRLRHPGPARRRAVGAALPALRRGADRRLHRHLGDPDRRSWSRRTPSSSGSAPAPCRPVPCPPPSRPPSAPWRPPAWRSRCAAALQDLVGPAVQPPRLRRATGDRGRPGRRGRRHRRRAVLREALDDPQLSVAYPGPDGSWGAGRSGRGTAWTWIGTAGWSLGSASTRTGRTPARSRRAATLAAAELDNTRLRAELVQPGRGDRRVPHPSGRCAAPRAAPDRARPARRRPAVAARPGLRAPVRPADRRPRADAAGAGRRGGRRPGRRPRAARPRQRAAPGRPGRRRAGGGARRHGPALPRAAAGAGRRAAGSTRARSSPRGR